MKTVDQVEKVLKRELSQWVRMQSAHPTERFYLFYIPSTPEHTGGLFVGKEKPANTKYRLAMTEHLNGFKTIDDNYNKAIRVLRTLPILD